MADEVEKRRSDMRWGIPASVALHVVLAAVLIFGLPLELPVPPEEEAVSVEIVEPPPEPEPAPEPADPEPQPEAPEEPPPPPAEQEQAPEPPPPPPETAAEEEAAEAPPIPTLRPVIEFGEETTGPKESREGDASTQGAEVPPEPEAEAEPQENPQAEAPEALAAAEAAEADAAEPATAPPETVEEPPEAEGQSSDEPVETLTEAKVLFSEDITEDPVARTAMEDLPRSMRATQLCETELTEQLRNASPPQDPDFIPRSPLSEGTVLELRQTAFRAKGQWYDLSFRCEINEDATKVMRFAFDIGAPVPRSEWRRRGFPGI